MAYAGATGASQDILFSNRFAQVGLGYALQDLLGTGTSIYGAACVPTSPASMNVQVNPGRIYTQAAIEPSAWSSLAANATLVQKQGILLNPVTLATPAPTTSGQSIAYLVEGQFQENDTDLAALSYFDSANPSAPFSGAGNNGIAQPKTRACQFAVQIKAGVPATTGTQVTPTVDATWIALAVVTVANGATTVTSGNIATVASAPYASALAPAGGSFILTGTGFSGTAPTVTAYWRTVGPMLTLMIPILTGTSNAATFGATGVPSNLQPSTFAGATQQVCAIGGVTNNGSLVGNGAAAISPGSGTLVFSLAGNSSGWTASGAKAVAGNLNFILY